MAALTPTLVVSMDSSAGKYKTKVFTVTPSSASDTVDLSTYFDTIKGILTPHITTGEDANLLTAHGTFSTTTVTIVTKDAAGSAATDWTGAAITLTVVGSDQGI
jgi:hypothetical protein